MQRTQSVTVKHFLQFSGQAAHVLLVSILSSPGFIQSTHSP